jgi:hypothetical protein
MPADTLPAQGSPPADAAALQTREEALSSCKSLKQRRFVEYYVQIGNAKRAAEEAGYSDASYGWELCRKTHVQQAIRALVQAETLSRAQVRHRLSQQALAHPSDAIDVVEVEHLVSYRPGGEWKVTNEITSSVGGATIETLNVDEAEELRLLHQYAREPSEDDEGRSLNDVREAARAGDVKFARVHIAVPVVNLEKARRRGVLGAIKELSFDSNGRPELKMYDSQAALKHLDKMYAMTEEAGSPEQVARSHLERVSEKMGLQVNVLNVNL